MIAKLRTIAWMMVVALVFGLTDSKQSSAENILIGQHTASVHLMLDSTADHEVYVEMYNTIVYFYVDGAPAPLISTYNNTFGALNLSVLGGSNGNHVVFNDRSNAYLAGVNVNLYFYGGAGNDSVEHGVNYWTQVDDATLVTDFPCTLYGYDGTDNLGGGNGDDIINGHEGMGIISGGGGDDILFGGNSFDSIHGDDGDDTIYGGNGWNFLYGDAGNDTIHGGTSLDNIDGGPGEDTIRGSQGNDNLDGGDDNDLIFGGPGNDIINGGDGDDVIKGESGLDEIFGGEGDDVMDGAGSQNFFWGFGLWYPTHHDSSNDILEGGPGADWFKNYMHLKPSGLFAVVADQDTMVDYNPKEGDIATQAIWEMTSLQILYFVW